MTTPAPYEPQESDFVQELLVTDTRVYQVAKRTAQTLTLRPTYAGETVRRENVDGNPYPVVYSEAVPFETDIAIVVRRRKDGSYRIGGQTASPLRAALVIDGKPVTVTDYRF